MMDNMEQKTLPAEDTAALTETELEAVSGGETEKTKVSSDRPPRPH